MDRHPAGPCDHLRDDLGVLGAGAALLPGGTAGAGADGADAVGRLDVLHVLRRDPRRAAARAGNLGLPPRFRPVERPAPRARLPDDQLSGTAALTSLGCPAAPRPD